jgi:hypothetical protein
MPAMPELKDGIHWFEKTLGSKIEGAIEQNTKISITLDLVTAIALQETYYLWAKFYSQLPLDQTLLLCVGDSLGGADGRSAFPASKAELLAAHDGGKMFNIARDSLKDIGKYRPEYKKKFDSDPDAFCHGFGIFQNDIQHYKSRPDFFLQKRWSDFDACLHRFIEEIEIAQAGAGLGGKKDLTDEEKTFVAIVYNMGSKKFDKAKGIKQGHLNKKEHKYYGEYIWDNLKIVHRARQP